MHVNNQTVKPKAMRGKKKKEFLRYIKAATNEIITLIEFVVSPLTHSL